VESFGLKVGLSQGRRKPMRNLVAEQFDGAEGRDSRRSFLSAGSAPSQEQARLRCRGRFYVIAEHADDAVVEVDGKTGELRRTSGSKRGERIKNKCVRWSLFSFSGLRMTGQDGKIADLVRNRLR